jgi:sugar lactone lactonase YvrE
MILPGGVAAMTRGGRESVFVADFWTVKEYDGQTGKLIDVKRHIETGAVLSAANTISPDGDNVIVSSWVGNDVYTLDPETGDVLEHYMDPSWLPLDAMRFMGDIVFSDLGSGSVSKIDGSSIASGLGIPTGLAAIGNDLYVADWYLGMVWQIVDDGTPVTVPVASGLSFPEGLAADTDGTLLVVETGAGCLSRIDPGTGMVTTVAEGLLLGSAPAPNLAPTFVFNDVDVGPSGYIYVTGDIADVLYRFKPTK